MLKLLYFEEYIEMKLISMFSKVQISNRTNIKRNLGFATWYETQKNEHLTQQTPG